VLAGCSTAAGSTNTAGADTDSNASSIDLAFRNNRNLTGRLGKIAGVTMDVPQSSGHASGNYASEPVNIQWAISNNGSSDQTVIPASLHGVVLERTSRSLVSFITRPTSFFNPVRFPGHSEAPLSRRE
jgi:hypothetical protein